MYRYIVKNMSKNALSETQRQVLGAIERTNSTSPSVIAKQLKLKTHTVQHAIARLQSSNAFSQAPFIDIHRTGRRWCGIFLSTSGSEAEESAFRKFIINHVQVGWCAELNGSFSWGIAIAVASPIEVDRFLKEVSLCSRASVYKKSLSFRTALMDCPRRYLSPRAPSEPHYYIVDGVDRIEIDILDRQILARLTEHPHASVRQLGAILGMPHTTIDLRLKKLREKKLLLGNSIQVNLSLLGRQLHKVLVFCRWKDDQLSGNLRRFALTHPLVSHFVESVGAWDFEFNIEVESLGEVSRFEGLLRRAFPDVVKDTVSLGIAAVHTLRRWVS
jgi:DNA-binding Lrp family transcriptional regulator